MTTKTATSLIQQEYDYLVIIDFEATCDEGMEPIVTKQNQECIEFPFCLYDVKSKKILIQHQLYCKPVWTTPLTAFCTQLTGITQQVIDADGISLQDALLMFDAFVQEHLTDKKWCILTDGNWDIKGLLIRECKAKQIELLNYFYKFFDLRREFQKVTGKYGRGLKHMLQLCNLQLHGRLHSGIDDCKNVASIVEYLQAQGHVFAVPEIVPADYHPDNDPSMNTDYNLTMKRKFQGFGSKNNT